MPSANKTSWFYILCLAAFTSLCGIAPRLHAQTSLPATALPANEEVLAEKSAASSPSDDEDTFSPDHQRFAWRDKRGEKWMVVVNGEAVGMLYDRIEWIIFSPDNQHVAYRAQRGKKWVVVLDGKEQGPEYDELGNPLYSPDGQHLAYRARQAKDWMMVTDGQAGLAYRELGTPRYSPDSRRFSYAAKKGDKWLNVLDGKEGSIYDEAGNPSFSPDSQHVIYAARRQKKWVMILDQKEQEREMDSAGAPLGFTPETPEPVYLLGLGTNKGWTVSMPGHQGPPVDIVSRPVFGSNAGRFAYAGARVERRAFRGERAFGQVVIDGTPGPVFEGQSVGGVGFSQAYLALGVVPTLVARWHGVSSPNLSPDGQHIAYAIRRGEKDFVVLLDGEAGPTFDNIPCGPSFARDGRLAFVGMQEDKLVLIVDAKRISEYTWIDKDLDDCSDVWFTDDGGHAIFTTIQSGRFFESGATARAKRRVFLDGVAGKEYDATAILKFHFGGGRLAYEVHRDKNAAGEASFVVIGDLEGPRYDDVAPESLSFPDENTATYLARRNRTILRVTHTLP